MLVTLIPRDLENASSALRLTRGRISVYFAHFMPGFIKGWYSFYVSYRETKSFFEKWYLKNFNFPYIHVCSPIFREKLLLFFIILLKFETFVQVIIEMHYERKIK